jgi:hypothetical protein
VEFDFWFEGLLWTSQGLGQLNFEPFGFGHIDNQIGELFGCVSIHDRLAAISCTEIIDEPEDPRFDGAHPQNMPLPIDPEQQRFGIVDRSQEDRRIFVNRIDTNVRLKDSGLEYFPFLL